MRIFVNHVDHNYHQLLRQFEDRNRLERCTPLQFLSAINPPPSLAFQIEVIAVDVELLLSRGIKPPLQVYLCDFPYLVDDIPNVYADVINTFIRSFCPVRSNGGSLTSTSNYEIGDEIDRGGMGVIYRAVQKSIGRQVALKVLFLRRENIFAEAKKIATLNHRNICRIYDVGQIGDFPFMAMQLIQGDSLKKKMQRGRPPIHVAVNIVLQIAEALTAAHEANLVHFDVKPGNIVVNSSGHAWLTDFGLARRSSEISSDVGSLQPASPVYCAPEQLSLQYGDRGFKSDIYSLGLVLYELLTGRRAFDGNTAQIIDQLKHDPPRRPTDYDPAIGIELEQVCLRAISKQPDNRFAYMSQFREALFSCALKHNAGRH